MNDQFLTDGVSVLRLDGSALAASVTGTTAEQVLASTRIPAGLLTVNGAIEVLHSWTFTNNANSKSVRVYVAGVMAFAFGVTSQAVGNYVYRMAMRGSLQQQLGTPNASLVYGQSGSGAWQAFTIDATQPIDVEIRCALANAADVATLEQWRVLIEP